MSEFVTLSNYHCTYYNYEFSFLVQHYFKLLFHIFAQVTPLFIIIFFFQIKVLTEDFLNSLACDDPS